ncbi:MAG: hypothetical protein QNI84_14045 [Henriciella sp.]|nr:hypothetical protein [Henriciella sp.]
MSAKPVSTPPSLAHLAANLGAYKYAICCQDRRCGHVAVIPWETFPQDLSVIDLKAALACYRCRHKQVEVYPIDCRTKTAGGLAQ